MGVEDAGRGWRRVVPSPPLASSSSRRSAGSSGYVRPVSGWGIPVVEDEHGDLVGIEAVIDKDFSASVLCWDQRHRS
jgi:carbamate kinase